MYANIYFQMNNQAKGTEYLINKSVHFNAVFLSFHEYIFYVIEDLFMITLILS